MLQTAATSVADVQREPNQQTRQSVCRRLVSAKMARHARFGRMKTFWLSCQQMCRMAEMQWHKCVTTTNPTSTPLNASEMNGRVETEDGNKWCDSICLLFFFLSIRRERETQNEVENETNTPAVQVHDASAVVKVKMQKW